MNVTVDRQPLPPGYNPSENFTTNIPDQTGMKFISHKTLDFNGTSVSENVYKMDMNGTTVQRTEMWISKNDALYSIIYTTSNLNLDEKSPEIEALTKNFTVTNTTVQNAKFGGKFYSLVKV